MSEEVPNNSYWKSNVRKSGSSKRKFDDIFSN